VKKPQGVNSPQPFQPSVPPHPHRIIRPLTGAAVWLLGIIGPWIVLTLVGWGILQLVVQAAAVLLGD